MSDVNSVKCLCVPLLLQAVIYYTESLKSTDTQIQQSSCLALKCLRVSDRHHNTHILTDMYCSFYQQRFFTHLLNSPVLKVGFFGSLPLNGKCGGGITMVTYFLISYVLRY